MSSLGHMFRTVGLVIAVAIFIAMPAEASVVDDTGPFTISYIKDNMGGELVVGDKTFSEFLAITSSTAGDGLPGEDEITLIGVLDDDTNEYGLLITAGWSAQSGESVDTLLFFRVDSTLPLLIADISLSVTGFQAVNGAEISVSEQDYRSPPPSIDLLCTLGARYCGAGNANNTISDHVEF